MRWQYVRGRGLRAGRITARLGGWLGLAAYMHDVAMAAARPDPIVGRAMSCDEETLGLSHGLATSSASTVPGRG